MMVKTPVFRYPFIAMVSAYFFLSGVAFATKADTTAINDSSIKVAWSYKGSKGPEFWGQLSPSFSACSQGKAQSPINIAGDFPSVAKKLAINYHPAPMVIAEDVPTEVNIGMKQMRVNMGKSVQVNFDKSSKETITYSGKSFRLIELHFHSPSENQINGKSSPLEIHFVHQGSHGDLAVLAVMVEGGNSNSEVEKIIEHLPLREGEEILVKGERINPNDLLPGLRHYYSFNGSLTTPPCTEGVKWVVMADPITASPAQIMALRNAIGGSNSRSVQPLNGRVISYRTEKNS